MQKIDLYISNEAPNVKGGAAWLKPVGGGFTLYVLDNGWKPVQLVDDKGTASEGDDIPIDTKNKADKVKSATNGNLAALNSNGNLTDSGKKASDFAPMGTDGDASTEMSLYGLKAYIDEQIEALG